MKHIEEKEVVYIDKIITKITCDKCNKEILPDDMVEWQEYYSISFMGGFGSKFGDEFGIECDLCQDCLYSMIKDYYRVIN